MMLSVGCQQDRLTEGLSGGCQQDGVTEGRLWECLHEGVDEASRVGVSRWEYRRPRFVAVCGID